MRVKRLERFRRNRYRKGMLIILFVIVVPLLSILAGYILTSLVILPVMASK